MLSESRDRRVAANQGVLMASVVAFQTLQEAVDFLLILIQAIGELLESL